MHVKKNRLRRSGRYTTVTRPLHPRFFSSDRATNRSLASHRYRGTGAWCRPLNVFPNIGPFGNVSGETTYLREPNLLSYSFSSENVFSTKKMQKTLLSKLRRDRRNPWTSSRAPKSTVEVQYMYVYDHYAFHRPWSTHRTPYKAIKSRPLHPDHPQNAQKKSKIGRAAADFPRFPIGTYHHAHQKPKTPRI